MSSVSTRFFSFPSTISIRASSVNVTDSNAFFSFCSKLRVPPPHTRVGNSIGWFGLQSLVLFFSFFFSFDYTNFFLQIADCAYSSSQPLHNMWRETKWMGPNNNLRCLGPLTSHVTHTHNTGIGQGFETRLRLEPQVYFLSFDHTILMLTIIYSRHCTQQPRWPRWPMRNNVNRPTSHITSYLTLSRKYPFNILIDAPSRDENWNFEPECVVYLLSFTSYCN
jgi:hypothetical protein